MSFKGEIALGALNSKYKYGFTVGDVYRVQGAGNLVPNNLAVANGAFVEWTRDGWEVKKDMQYAVSKTGESLDDMAASIMELIVSGMCEADKMQVIAAALNDLDARLKAVEESISSVNIGYRVADELDAQSLKVGGEDINTIIQNAIGG